MSQIRGSTEYITQVLFDHDGCLKKYTTVMEILQEFYKVRVQIIVFIEVCKCIIILHLHTSMLLLNLCAKFINIFVNSYFGANDSAC